MKNWLSFLVLFSGILFSCSNDDLLSNHQQDFDPNGMAVLAVFNGVLGSDQMDVLLNGERQNSGTENFRYGEVLRHRTVYPGKRKLQVSWRAGNQTITPPALDVDLLAGKNYSLFLTAGNPITLSLVEDDLLLPKDGQFKLRFANTAPNGSAVSLGTNDDISRFFSAVEIGKMSAFSTFEVGEFALQFSGSGNSRASKTFDFKPVNRGVYTIWLTGNLNASEQSNAIFSVIKHP